MRGSEDAFLLVDHYKVHMMGSFVNACNNLGVDVDYIPAGYTCVLQPIDVGFNAPLKRHIRDFHHKWCIEKYRGITNAMKLPTPTKEDIIDWVIKSYDRISEESIRKTFLSIGYKIDLSTPTIEQETNIQNMDNNYNEEGQIDFHDLYLRQP